MTKRDDIYLREIETRIQVIGSHLKNFTQAKFEKSDLHRSAVIRELEVIGEAANKVSPEARKNLKAIPWDQMIGMRNRLIHGYFDVDLSIAWEVAKHQLPSLLDPIRIAILETAPPVHPWRICPAGFYHVQQHGRTVTTTPTHPEGKTSVRRHCRRNPSGKDQLYPKEILEVADVAKAALSGLGTVNKLNEPTTANDFDTLILIWTKYWNDIFSPSEALGPNSVKALLGSESSFDPKVKDVKIRKRNFARGLFQISDETRNILRNEKGELADHYLTLTAQDVKDPAIATSASIRWLFHKKEMASKFLKRSATWEEAVADYKGYLRKKGDPFQKKGMKRFMQLLESLRGHP